MSTDDHTMTVLTGAVFAVAIGVSVQNSSWLMEQFSPKVYRGAVADAFVMRAGHSQKLDVLSNDDFKDVASFEIVDAPSCGIAQAIDGAINFIAGPECAGPVSFTYCVQANGSCEPANVALNIRGTALTVAAAETAPQEPVKQRIKRVKRVAKKPSKTTASSSSVVDDRPVADASKPHLPKEQLNSPSRFTPQDEAAPRLAQNAIVVAPPLLAPKFNEGDTQVTAMIDTTQPLLKFNAVTDVVALTDAVTTTTQSQLGLSSRTATRLRGDCDVELRTQVRSGGIIHLSVEAPCFAGETARVQHAGLAYDLDANEWGMAEIEIPAFEVEAELLVSFEGNETGARVVQYVPEMSRLHRVALIWRGKAELGLHAFEFGAEQGSRGHVNPVNPRDYKAATTASGGYLDRIEIRDDTFADIYTLPGGKTTAGGNVSLAVSTRSHGCDDAVSFMTLHAEPGQEMTSRAYELSAKACKRLVEASPDQNLVPQLALALNTQ